MASNVTVNGLTPVATTNLQLNVPSPTNATTTTTTPMPRFAKGWAIQRKPLAPRQPAAAPAASSTPTSFSSPTAQSPTALSPSSASSATMRTKRKFNDFQATIPTASTQALYNAVMALRDSTSGTISEAEKVDRFVDLMKQSDTTSTEARLLLAREILRITHPDAQQKVLQHVGVIAMWLTHPQSTTELLNISLAALEHLPINVHIWQEAHIDKALQHASSSASVQSDDNVRQMASQLLVQWHHTRQGAFKNEAISLKNRSFVPEDEVDKKDDDEDANIQVVSRAPTAQIKSLLSGPDKKKRRKSLTWREHKISDVRLFNLHEPPIVVSQPTVDPTAKMEATIPWTTPIVLNLPEEFRPPRGLESKEVAVQAARDKANLSVFYFRIQDIPECPMEPVPEPDYDDSKVPIVPFDIPGIAATYEQPATYAPSYPASTGGYPASSSPVPAPAPASNGTEAPLDLINALLSNPGLLSTLAASASGTPAPVSAPSDASLAPQPSYAPPPPGYAPPPGEYAPDPYYQGPPPPHDPWGPPPPMHHDYPNGGPYHGEPPYDDDRWRDRDMRDGREPRDRMRDRDRRRPVRARRRESLSPERRPERGSDRGGDPTMLKDNRPPGAGPKRKIPAACRFFNSSRGCRNGDDCPFIHDPSAPPPNERFDDRTRDRGRPDREFRRPSR